MRGFQAEKACFSKASRALAATVLPILIEAVAAGEGALRT
jgi:hypothetical protein